MNDSRRMVSTLRLVIFCLCLSGFGLRALCQDPDPAPQEKEKPPAPIKLSAKGLDPASAKDIQFADPIKVRLTAKDNFELAATFYPGIYGRNTPAVILLHDVLGSSADLGDLASYLQKTFGFAVLLPDLRGHGESKKSGDREIDPAKISRAEFEAFGLDIEACKKHLLGRNDAEELNVDLLTIVAVGKSCVPAVFWSLNDWNYPALAGLRQGQDVKAVVLISPEQGFKGLRMVSALHAGIFNGKDVAKPLRVLLAVGRDNPELVKECEAIQSTVERYRKVTDGVVDGLFVLSDYSSNGSSLTKPDAGDLQKLIGQLIFLEIYQKADQHPWQLRGKK